MPPELFSLQNYGEIVLWIIIIDGKVDKDKRSSCL